MSTPRAAIILAAGKSTRMKSATSKVLHEVGGRSMLGWVASLARSVGADKIVCVVGAANQDVRAAAEDLGLEIALQEPQLGTGHAVSAAKDVMAGFEGHVTVLCADAPLFTQTTLEGVYQSLENGADVSVLGFVPDDPGAYGRLVVEGDDLTAIVEAREASPEQLKITLCNSGMMAGDCIHLFEALAQVTNDNAKGEYYLTDVVEITRNMGKKAVASVADANEVLGVNSRKDLALAEAAFQTNMRNIMMDDGVTLRDPATVYFSYDTQIDPDAVIGGHVVFGPGVTVAKNAVIHPFCHIEGADIKAGAQIGPFARLRPGTVMGENSKAGNFVETKKAIVGKGSKINHLSYIGDAQLGEGVNVGAGTITCNYDGYFKHLTQIGDGAFIGSNSSLIAPVKIGKGSYLGSGSVVSDDVPDDALALSRAIQTHKEGWAKRYRVTQEKRKKKKS